MNKMITEISDEIMGLIKIESPVIKSTPIGEADREKLENTIESAFGETLVDGYFADMLGQGAVVCHEKHYGSVGVVIPNLYHVVTLATHPTCRGQHIGEQILMEILAKLGKFNLRSKPDRTPANRIYQRIADDNLSITAVDGVAYNVYWKNHSLLEVAVALNYNTQQPSHFKK